MSIRIVCTYMCVCVSTAIVVYAQARCWVGLLSTARCHCLSCYRCTSVASHGPLCMTHYTRIRYAATSHTSHGNRLRLCCWIHVVAVQDKKDDAALGLKSTALTFGDTHSKSIMGCFAALSGASFWLAGHTAGLSSLPLTLGTAAAVAHLAWQVHNPPECGFVVKIGVAIVFL